MKLTFPCKAPRIYVVIPFVSVCLLIASLIVGSDLNLPGQRIVALAILNDIYKSDSPFSPLFIHLLEGKSGLQPLLPQERYFLGVLINGTARDVYIAAYFTQNTFNIFVANLFR